MRFTNYQGYKIEEVCGDCGSGETHVEVSKDGQFIMSCDTLDEALWNIDEI